MQAVNFYLLLLNAAAFAAMGADKRKAIRGDYRIPERTLFLLSFIGGSLGAYTGMYCFRHKTRHKKFVIGMPLILIFHLAVYVILISGLSY